MDTREAMASYKRMESRRRWNKGQIERDMRTENLLLQDIPIESKTASPADLLRLDGNPQSSCNYGSLTDGLGVYRKDKDWEGLSFGRTGNRHSN